MMATNKERIENLEVGLRGLQDEMSWLELGFVDIFYQIEEALNMLFVAVLSNKNGSSSNTNNQDGHFCNNRNEFKENTKGG